MPINSVEKGKVGEREFAKYLRGHGFEARRGQQHKGGADSPDVITDMGRLQWEVKRRQAFNLPDAVDKLSDETDFMDVAVVAHRKNRRRWLATLSMHDFLRMYRVLKDHNLLGKI